MGSMPAVEDDAPADEEVGKNAGVKAGHEGEEGTGDSDREEGAGKRAALGVVEEADEDEAVNAQPGQSKRRKHGSGDSGGSGEKKREDRPEDTSHANGTQAQVSLDSFALGALAKVRSEDGSGAGGRRGVVAVDPTESGAQTKAKRANRADNKMVRTDATTLRLDSFLRPLTTAASGNTAGDDGDGARLAGSKRRLDDGKEGAWSSSSSSSATTTVVAADCGECGEPLVMTTGISITALYRIP